MRIFRFINPTLSIRLFEFSLWGTEDAGIFIGGYSSSLVCETRNSDFHSDLVSSTTEEYV